MEEGQDFRELSEEIESVVRETAKIISRGGRKFRVNFLREGPNRNALIVAISDRDYPAWATIRADWDRMVYHTRVWRSLVGQEHIVSDHSSIEEALNAACKDLLRANAFGRRDDSDSKLERFYESLE